MQQGATSTERNIRIDHRIRRVFGLDANTLTDEQIGAVTRVLDYENRFGPVYNAKFRYDAGDVLSAIKMTLRNCFDCEWEDVMNKRRTAHIVFLRYCVLSIFSKLTGMSDQAVSIYIKYGDRTNVMYARKMSEELSGDANFMNKYSTMMSGVTTILDSKWRAC